MKKGLIIALGALAVLYYMNQKPTSTTTVMPTGTPVSAGDDQKRTYLLNYYNYYLAPGNTAAVTANFKNALVTMSSSELNTLYTYVTNYLLGENIAPPEGATAAVNSIEINYGLTGLFT